jgi:hypothetical protein
MDAKNRELLNRDVDGAVTDTDRQQVQRLLKRSAEARRFHAELTRLSRLLSGVPEVDPPVHLANRIRAAVHGQDAPVQSRARSWREKLIALSHPPTPLRYGSVFAGGLAAGLFLFMAFLQPLDRSSVPDSAAAGTVVGRAESITVAAGDASGSVRVMRLGGSSELAVRMTLNRGIVTRLSFDPSRIALKGIRGPETPSGSLTVREGVVELAGTGIQACTLDLVPRTAGATVAVSLMGPEGELLRKSIPVAD